MDMKFIGMLWEKRVLKAHTRSVILVSQKGIGHSLPFIPPTYSPSQIKWQKCI